MDIVTTLIGGGIALIGSLVGSFSGGGASLIILPLLLMLSPASSYVSLLAITKVSALIMTSTSSRIHYGRNKLNWKFLIIITIAGLLGTALGTYFIQYQFNELLFKRLLGLSMLATALYMALAKDVGKGDQEEISMNFKVYGYSVLFSFFSAILNGMFGGGGFFLTVFMVSYLRMNFLLAIVYTMATAVIINFFQAGYLLLTEPVNWWLAFAVAMGALMGAFFGTHLQYLKGNLWIKRMVIVMMLTIGVSMLLN